MNKPDCFPLLSIIVPAFNSESSLSRCVDSVFDSGTPDLMEVIIIDDCSADQTEDICAQLSKRYPQVRTFRNAKNLGVAESRNKGISLARGRYVGFLDSDDYYQSEQYGQTALDSLNKYDCDLILFPTENIARDDHLYRALADVDNLKGGSLIQRINQSQTEIDECNGCFVSRDFLINNQLSFPPMSVGEDKVFMCFLVLKAKTFSYFDRIQYVHTANAGGLATAFRIQNISAYSDGIDIVRRLHSSQRDDGKKQFLAQVLVSLFKSLSCYLLIFSQEKGISFDDRTNENLEWMSKSILPEFQSIRVSSPISQRALVDGFINEIYCQIPEILRHTDGINYVYCLSEYSAAALGALNHQGVEIAAIIDDNRAGTADYTHAGLPVRSLNEIECPGQTSLAGKEHRFFVCHPSQTVYENIKVRLLDHGILEKNIVWIKFFD